ncbi:PREDICTED: potassium voltage-gated channel protein Shaw-like [Priapulus caudatus]|uniref:Potassium voltage-gated channel protein Shaw-like n=1 Tax=Priapulus caudatus TaxID=37621 RepID=A0ABM1EMH0_PRICU|nr:PREDICTED: potassium voltage-gated channel protein Shaw-like [Priapulus caudatus]
MFTTDPRQGIKCKPIQEGNKKNTSINILSLVFIAISIVTYCTETVEGARVWVAIYSHNASANATQLVGLTSEPSSALDVIEWIVTVYFTLELLLRFAFSPDKRAFTRGALNVVDLLSIMPFYCKLIIKAVNPNVTQKTLEFLNFFRVVRIFRIFKLTRHLSGLKILFHTIKASLKELFLLIMIIVIGILIFASLIYYAERFADNPENDFDSIFRGFWWALITMTTIGYGDVVPKTVSGE